MQIMGDILLIPRLSILTLLVFRRMGTSPIAEYLLIGVLAGPRGLGLLTEFRAAEKLCEIGAALLLFTIGVELSMGKQGLRRPVFVGSPFYVFAVAAAISTAVVRFSLPPGVRICRWTG